jgi:cytoskeletal protein CcmA (bactofilin family)
MNRIDDHFDEVTGLLYLEHQLDPGRAADVSVHLAACPACSGLLRALESESVWLRRALLAEDESVPSYLVAAPARTSAHWGWIAAFALAVGGVYTLWSGFIQPWLAQASQAGFTQGNLLTMLFFSGAFWKGWDSMRNTMEFLPVAALGAVGIWLLRKQWRNFTPIALVMGVLVCALALPPSAIAAEVQHGDPSYTLPAGQEVKTDLVVAAERTRIDGDVDGDLIVFSDSVTVNGHVKGDILGFAEEIQVNGPVDGNVRVWCQSLSLNSTVAKNVMSWTGRTELDEKATVDGTMTLFSGNSELDGRITGDLLALVGDLEINGKLGHDARIQASRLTIGSSAEILGRTKYRGRRQPQIAEGAKLASPIDVTLRKPGPDYSQFAYYWHQVLFWGASFLFGLVLLFLTPAFYADTTAAANKFGPAVGWGSLFLIAAPVIAVILCITIIGLGVGIATILVYLIAVYAAQIFVGSWLGEKVLGMGVGVGPAIGRLALGLAIVHLVRMLPYLGALVGAIVSVWGLGALVLALRKNLRPQRQVAPA